MAAASYSVDGTTGAITPVGSATATVGLGSGAVFPSDSSIGLPGNLQADSNYDTIADPPGAATSYSFGDPGPDYSSGQYNDYSDHDRGGAYIYQNNSLVWGENVDTGVIDDTETVTVSPSTYQNNFANSGLYLYLGFDATITASSEDGSAALADAYLLAVTTAIP